MMGLSTEEAFFSLFKDLERCFLFGSFCPGKDPFKGNMEKTFLKFYYRFCYGCYYNSHSCCNDNINIVSSSSYNSNKVLLYQIFFASPSCDKSNSLHFGQSATVQIHLALRIPRLCKNQYDFITPL